MISPRTEPQGDIKIMPTYPFETVDVFTEQRFGGNPLAVVTDGQGLTTAQMQAISAEFNLSETTFVLPPEDPANSARVRIFDRVAEMPFAGHPMVGTGYVLAKKGLDRDGVLTFEIPAGVVRIEIERDGAGEVLGARIAAPRTLTTGGDVDAATVAACADLAPDDIIVTSHPPRLASLGLGFVFAETTDAALARARPNVAAFRDALAKYPQVGGGWPLHLYTRETDGVRARMFAPLANTFEDPATGSANTALVALLLSLTDADEIRLKVRQGIEMGRPSELDLLARRTADGIRAEVAGRCVPVLRGEIAV
jgi:trans-2,3-dihydro-3-hydroxyanthranilate isomerase